MESVVEYEDEEGGGVELPPGFRFHPSDEELITHYLIPKILDKDFVARAIGEVDLNKCEPWDLPRRAKMGEKEWYVFSVRDRKYPTGLRTNRATDAGYWKATGKDKQIFRGNVLVGMKKTLVFYIGRAPKGENSNWVIHEFRLDGETTLQNIPSNAKEKEWVISRVFKKNTAAGEKIHSARLISQESCNIQYKYNHSGNLPPLTESSPYNTTKTDVSHVPCFSNADQFSYDGFLRNPFQSISSLPEASIVRGIIDNNATEMKTDEFDNTASFDTVLTSDHVNAEISSIVSNYDISQGLFNATDDPSMSGGPVDLDNLLNYW